jgi:thymidylate synthase (FAD)
MKLIKQSFEITNQEDFTLVGIKKHIEKCARVCYKSEDKITDDSYEKFVDNLIKRGHGRCLEFGTVYLKYFWSGRVCDSCNQTWPDKMDKYYINKYSVVRRHGNDIYITTNYRVIIENGWEDDLKYLCEPTEYHAKRYTVHFITNRAIMDEFRTHVSLSHLAESTRYCNYSKDKFDNQITFIQPSWIILDKEIAPINELCLLSGQYDRENPNLRYLASLVDANYAYVSLLNKGWTPQQARDVLPLSVKSELISCGFEDAWANFFYRRCANDAHPMARELAIPLREEFLNRKYILKLI